jgi:hypothetical protein
MSTVAVVPTKRGALERAAAFLEHHLAELRADAMRSDANGGYQDAERLVLDTMETAFAAGMLREMAEMSGDAERTRAPR